MSGTDDATDGERSRRTAPGAREAGADGSGADLDLPSLSAGRRTVMGALAAGVGLGAVGGVAAQDDDDGQDGDDDQDDDAMGAVERASMASLSAAEHGVFSEAHGGALVIEGDGGAIDFVLHVEHMDCVTQAHVHEGNSCESGPIVAPLALYTETPAGDGDGAQENLRHADRDAPILEAGTVEPAGNGEEGPTQEALQDILDDPDQYYVNVHSTHHPGGEIRGQLRDLATATPAGGGTPGGDGDMGDGDDGGADDDGNGGMGDDDGDDDSNNDDDAGGDDGTGGGVGNETDT